MNDQNNENVVSGIYDNYKETQAEIYQIEIRRTRNSILWVGIIYFASILLSFAIANIWNMELFLYSMIFPVAFWGVAFLAMKQPLVSAVIAALIFIGIIILEFRAAGGRAAISGWLIKAAIVYFLFAAFQSAREAERAKKEMA